MLALPVTSPVTLPVKLPVIFVEFKVVIVPIPDTFKLLSFNITPSIVTPLLLVFSLILFTFKLFVRFILFVTFKLAFISTLSFEIFTILTSFTDILLLCVLFIISLLLLSNFKLALTTPVLLRFICGTSLFPEPVELKVICANPDCSNKIVSKELKFVAVPTFNLLFFKITPSIVTPVLLVFSLILSTFKLPPIFKFCVISPNPSIYKSLSILDIYIYIYNII